MPRLTPSPAHVAAVAAAAFALIAASGAGAQTATLAPQAERIGDAVIQQDYAAFERMQSRIEALNDGGRRVADYTLAKAQCWLDASFHEYTRNDRSPFPQAALSESEKLVQAMETKADPLPSDTPLVNGAARLRPDLWERAAGLRRSGGFACAAQKTACAEVELVHAGNEYKQQGWRHAKPYVQIAEDALDAATVEAARCAPPAAVVAAAAPPPVPQAPAATGERPVVRTADVVFAFDRAGRADIRAASREALDAMLASLRRDALSIVSIALVGHADRLNGTGHADYNQRLSLRRAETVRALLVERGIDARLVSVAARGADEPVTACPASVRSKAGLEACLSSDRRVAVVVTAVRAP